MSELSFGETRRPLYRCVFSEDRVYRYVLSDSWAPQNGRVAFIGLNPSTADEYKLDPTLKRVRRWVESWGFGEFVMLNLFAFRSPDPKVMQAHPNPEGPENNHWIVKICEASPVVVAAWGARGEFKGRAGFVESLLSGVLARSPRPMQCLGKTKDGWPIHPLARGKSRLPDNLQLQSFR